MNSTTKQKRKKPQMKPEKQDTTPEDGGGGEMVKYRNKKQRKCFIINMPEDTQNDLLLFFSFVALYYDPMTLGNRARVQFFLLYSLLLSVFSLC